MEATTSAQPEKPEGNGGRVNLELYVIAGKGTPKLIGFTRFSRFAKGGRWVAGTPVTIHATQGPAKAGC